jgi:hypothetical protein
MVLLLHFSKKIYDFLNQRIKKLKKNKKIKLLIIRVLL